MIKQSFGHKILPGYINTAKNMVVRLGTHQEDKANNMLARNLQ